MVRDPLGSPGRLVCGLTPAFWVRLKERISINKLEAGRLEEVLTWKVPKSMEEMARFALKSMPSDPLFVVLSARSLLSVSKDILVRISGGGWLVVEAFITNGDKMVGVDGLNVCRHLLYPRGNGSRRACSSRSSEKLSVNFIIKKGPNLKLTLCCLCTWARLRAPRP